MRFTKEKSMDIFGPGQEKIPWRIATGMSWLIDCKREKHLGKYFQTNHRFTITIKAN
jgi:hypothetical protein